MFCVQILVLLRKVFPLEKEDLKDAHGLGNTGYVNELDQDRLPVLLHRYKNILNYFLFNCFFNLSISLVYIKMLSNT